MNFSSTISMLYSEVESSNKSFAIDKDVVEEAISILRFHIIENKNDVFLFLAAINLLNAAIKLPEYRTHLRYGFIKGKVLVLIKLLQTRFRYKMKDVLSYYNMEERCMYIKIYEIVFSFHNVQENDFVLVNSTNKEKIVWPGIRLQKIAQPLFMLAKDYL